MFLVGDSSSGREKRIRGFLTKDDCAISVLLAAAHFEWTVSRGILALGTTPTARLRKTVGLCHGLDKYSELWACEIPAGQSVGRLPSVIQDWAVFKDHFKLRHMLIHGRESCSLDYARPRVNSILRAASDIFTVCERQGIDLHSRLKSRRKPR